MASEIHPLADVQTPNVGEDTRVWQYCIILPGASIGKQCNICSHVFIENDVRVGDRATIKSGVQLWDGVRLEDDVFIGPNVTFTNDPFPRSKVFPDSFQETHIHAGASIGANATILGGVKIGRKAMIGAGSVVSRDVPAYAIVRGNPARITGYVEENSGPQVEPIIPTASTCPETVISGVDLHRLPITSDLRGDLLPLELEKTIPFPVLRIFFQLNVGSQHIRGDHAHRECHQFLFCLNGSVSISLDNGQEHRTLVLDHPEVGLHVKPRIWMSQFQFSTDAVIAVLASHPYDPDDYIRDYEDYRRFLEELT